MVYRPPLPDPTLGHSFDERALCQRCNRAVDPGEPMVRAPEGVIICRECADDDMDLL